MYLIPNLFVHRRSSAFWSWSKQLIMSQQILFLNKKVYGSNPPMYLFACVIVCPKAVFMSRSRVHSTGEPCLRIHSWGQKHIVTAAQFVPLLIAFCPELQRGHEPLPQPPYIHPPPPPKKKKKKEEKKKKKLTSRVEIEAAVVIVLMASVDVKQHWTVKRLL